MRPGGIVVLILVLILIVGAAVVVGYAKTYGFSARAQPSRPERFVAHRLLELSYPESAKTMKNPLEATTGALAEGRESYAHQCAFCHGDDGSAQTAAGQGMYPKAAKLRHENDMSDGVLFYIIRNGVRYTGMPGSSDSDAEIWKMVLHIRQLPNSQPEGQGQSAAAQ